MTLRASKSRRMIRMPCTGGVAGESISSRQVVPRLHGTLGQRSSGSSFHLGIDMPLVAVINCLLRLGEKQPLLAVILAALLSLAAVAVGCVYLSSSNSHSATVAAIIFAVFAVVVVALVHLALLFMERLAALRGKNEA